MNPASLHRTLIVANLTAQTPLLLKEVERRASARPTAFSLLVPGSSKRSDWTLDEALTSLRRAARGPSGTLEAQVEGLIGGSDAFESIKRALAEWPFDDAIISTLPKRRSEWLRRDLPRRVEQLGVPVTVITQAEDTTRSSVETFLTASGGGLVPPDYTKPDRYRGTDG